ncbi:MAG: hypothetical protein F9K40_08770 [Kofleriaceae bacterium]|nr:MAG: hypothetical protein F9K40_08770 [Kofleriaceae bacterium]MBZ0233281.1 hypothetical protein [Kofleriaceae bacterium]
MPALTRALAALALVATVLAAPAAASPAEEMNTARDAFRRRDWQAAMPILSSLLYPTPRLSSEEDIYEAHLLLGMSAYESNDRLTATREFEEAIVLQLERKLGTGVFSDDAVALYEERRQALVEKYRLDAEKRALALEREKYRRLVEAMVIVEKRDYYVNFIPFGAGQFQNKQLKKGIFFATAQGVTGAVSAGIWMYLVGSYGLSGTVPNADANDVRRLQQIEIGAGAAFLGLAAWGIVDALVNYKPSIVRKPDESLLPPDLKPAPRSTTRLAPTPLPGGGGVVMTWEF